MTTFPKYSQNLYHRIYTTLLNTLTFRTQHDQFHAQLEKAEDGFNIVAEYLGRGLFSQPQEVAVPDLTKVERRPVEDLRENSSEGRLRAGERRREEVRTETESRLRSLLIINNN